MSIYIRDQFPDLAFSSGVRSAQLATNKYKSNVQEIGGAFGRRVFPLRASSVPTLLECPARWKAIHLDGLPSLGSAAAKFGTSIHAGVAALDRRLMVDGGTAILEEAVATFQDELVKPEEGVTWETGDLDKAQKIGFELLRKYAEDIAPHQKFVAIELKCPSLDIFVEGITLRLTGTVDRIRQVDSVGYGITDFKTGEQAVRANGTVVVGPHRAQVGVYEILAAHVTGVQMAAPAEIIGMQSIGKARIGIGSINGAIESMIGTEQVPGTLVYIARLLREGIYYGNPKSLMCSEKYCPAFKSCRFRE